MVHASPPGHRIGENTRCYCQLWPIFSAAPIRRAFPSPEQRRTGGLAAGAVCERLPAVCRARRANAAVASISGASSVLVFYDQPILEPVDCRLEAPIGLRDDPRRRFHSCINESLGHYSLADRIAPEHGAPLHALVARVVGSIA